MWNLLPYEIELPVFHGPLDLLLHLIERQELDISAVSLAQVTEQYLEHLSRLEELEAGVLADFLVVASRLILIKSRLLLPRPPSPEEDEEEEDPAETLARQLRAYKMFKEAAQTLRAWEQRGWRAYVRIAAPPALERRLEMGSVTVADLVQAMQQILAEKPPADGSVRVVPYTVTIHDKVRLMRELFRRRSVVRFRELLERAPNRVEIVVTFLAVLELIKRRQILVEQPEPFGEITVALAPGVDPDRLDAFSNGDQEGPPPPL
ncbi:MAG: ScpA family protein [Anaerolineae bacterium]